MTAGQRQVSSGHFPSLSTAGPSCQTPEVSPVFQVAREEQHLQNVTPGRSLIPVLTHIHCWEQDTGTDRRLPWPCAAPPAPTGCLGSLS